MPSKPEKELLVALDIGTSKIVAIVGEMQEDGELEVIGFGSHPSRGLNRTDGGLDIDDHTFLQSARYGRWGGSIFFMGESFAGGETPWTYKPVSCWMHPVALVPGEPPRLTIAGNTKDPTDFASHTHCGRPCEHAPPAWETLRKELRLLGEIAGRDFLVELSIGHGQSPV